MNLSIEIKEPTPIEIRYGWDYVILHKGIYKPIETDSIANTRLVTFHNPGGIPFTLCMMQGGLITVPLREFWGNRSFVKLDEKLTVTFEANACPWLE